MKFLKIIFCVFFICILFSSFCLAKDNDIEIIKDKIEIIKNRYNKTEVTDKLNELFESYKTIDSFLMEFEQKFANSIHIDQVNIKYNHRRNSLFFRRLFEDLNSFSLGKYLNYDFPCDDYWLSLLKNRMKNFLDRITDYSKLIDTDYSIESYYLSDTLKNLIEDLINNYNEFFDIIPIDKSDDKIYKRAYQLYNRINDFLYGIYIDLQQLSESHL